MLRASRPDLSAGDYLKKLSWSDGKEGKNLALVNNFMQMKEFKYKFKNGEIEYIYN